MVCFFFERKNNVKEVGSFIVDNDRIVSPWLFVVAVVNGDSVGAGGYIKLVSPIGAEGSLLGYAGDGYNNIFCPV